MPTTGYSFPIPCTILVSAESDSSEPPESLRESRTSLLITPGPSWRIREGPEAPPAGLLSQAPPRSGAYWSRRAGQSIGGRYAVRAVPVLAPEVVAGPDGTAMSPTTLQRHERHADLLQPGRDGEGLLLTPQGTPVLEGGLSMAMAAAGARGELVARGCERLRVGVQSRCALGRRADRRRKRFGASEGGRGGGDPVQPAPSSAP